MKTNRFILSTDFGTLKNDTQSNVISVTINAGTLFDPSNPQLGSATIDVGTRNAGIRARGASDKYGIWTVGTTLYSTVLVSVPSDPFIPPFVQTLYCNLDRISPSTVRLTVGTDGTSGAPTFRVDDTQTITFVFSTFLSPFI